MDRVSAVARCVAPPKIEYLDELAFGENGLLPCVVQDWRTGEVLTVAYMNEEALARTRETGETWFWSRSRQELWHKGATSGNVQRVRELRWDCDADTLLALVEPAGPACHTGERTCFFQGDQARAPHEALPALERVVEGRKASTQPPSTTNPGDRINPVPPRTEAPSSSYTQQLLNDPPLIGAKVQEEAEEVARAAREESDERVAEEAADLLYHLTVLLASRELSLADAYEVLNARRR
jgi:phosphoribosyl-AMP cyclohydrolase / phosphoribosyl-ATP pyrophosphohydrolase